ncbi:MAG TPA: nucleotidyltransferase domain-containing protein [Geobacteraceae bacterium]|nr:nucleotidyltransferase domain-containing protein [Geobacteraceae bacterium]
MQPKSAADISHVQRNKYRPFRSIRRQRPTEKVEEAKETATAIACELKERFCANRVMLFGSLARDDFHEWSDIDLAVWGVAPTEYFRAVAFASGFSKVFKVDLVDAQDCSESLLQHVLKEGVEL